MLTRSTSLPEGIGGSAGGGGPVEQPARYWQTTVAGVGIETGRGYRAGVCTFPRPISPAGSAFHPVRGKRSDRLKFREVYKRSDAECAVRPSEFTDRANVGDKNLYVYERRGTALWSSVLENMPAPTDEPPPGNCNWQSAHLGDPKTHVRERQHTLLESNRLDKMAADVLSPPMTAGTVSISNISAATSKAMVSKIQELEVAIAREEQRRARLIEEQQVRSRLALAAAGPYQAPGVDAVLLQPHASRAQS